jgi:phosphatidate phosphatase APP1
MRKRYILSALVLLIVVLAAWNLLARHSSDNVALATSDNLNAATPTEAVASLRETKIETADVIAKVGEPFVIRAELEAKTFLGIANDLAYLPVEFYCGDRLLDTAITDKEGVAVIALTLEHAQTMPVTISFSGTNRYGASSAQSDVFVLDGSRPIIVVDIDHTVADVSTLGVLTKKSTEQKPMPASVEALNALAADYQIVFLTHRSALLRAKTKAWLRESGFPRAPIILWHPGQEPLLSMTFKAEAIAKLKRDFPHVAVGIGDKKSDAQAYVKNGLQPYILESEKSQNHYPSGTVVVNDWKEIFRRLKRAQ